MQVEKRFKEALGEVLDNFYPNMEKASIFMLNKVDEKFTGSRIGKTYRVPDTSRYYTASKGDPANEPPAIRTGALRQSMRYVINRMNDEAIVSSIGSDLDYAPYLEYGTRRMDKRPYLWPAFEENREQLMRIIGGEVTWV